MAADNNEKTRNSPIYEEGKILLRDLIKYKQDETLSPVNATAKTLRKLSDDIEERNPHLFTQMCSKLNLSKHNVFSSFCNVAKEMFSDGIINWGRIATLFAFACQVAKHCLEHNIGDQVNHITDWTATFVGEMGWIEQQGGWSAINNHFGDDDRKHGGKWWFLLW